LRETDTVARIGGDEFAIVQVSPKGEADVRRLCERIISVIRQPFIIGEREARVGVSIGAVFASKEVAEAMDLRRDSLNERQRCAFEDLALLLALIPDLADWTVDQKRAVIQIVRAKAGRDESLYARRLQKHKRLRDAIIKIGS